MIDDDVITRLVELHGHIKAPDFIPGEDAFRGEQALRRRRTVAMAAAAAAVVTVLGITALAVNGQQGGDGTAPVGPGPTPTPSTDADWPLERVRAEGDMEAEDFTASGITVRLYGRCDESLRGPDVPERVESVCDPDIDAPIRRAYSQFALEVAQNGQSALFSVYGEGGSVVAAYGDDAVVYSDHESRVQSLYTDRFRLLRADGSEEQLELRMDSPVPADPGPGVVAVYLDGIGSPGGVSHPFLLDEKEGTLRPLETSRSAERRDQVESELGAWYPEVGLSWGPNTEESLWFVYHDCTVRWGSGEFWGDGGTLTEYELDCADGFDGAWGEDDFTYLSPTMFPAGWLGPGRMAAVEDSDGQLFLHVTLDQGESWQRIPVSDESAIPATLRQFG